MGPRACPPQAPPTPFSCPSLEWAEWGPAGPTESGRCGEGPPPIPRPASDRRGLRRWERPVPAEARPRGPGSSRRLQRVRCSQGSQARQHPAGRPHLRKVPVSPVLRPRPPAGSLRSQLVFSADKTDVIASSSTLRSLPDGRGQRVSSCVSCLGGRGSGPPAPSRGALVPWGRGLPCSRPGPLIGRVRGSIPGSHPPSRSRWRTDLRGSCGARGSEWLTLPRLPAVNFMAGVWPWRSPHRARTRLGRSHEDYRELLTESNF